MNLVPARVKAAIATIANQKCGVETFEVTGIFKWEGGVVVNRREIAIKSGYVVDDFVRRGVPDLVTKEEQATVDAVLEVALMLEEHGIKWLEKFAPCDTGDPLRCLLGLI
jgi:hypothetical protein